MSAGNRFLKACPWLRNYPVIRMIATRRKAYAEVLPLKGRGAECGVLAGENLADLLSGANPSKLWAVDLWDAPLCQRGKVELMAAADKRIEIVTSRADKWLSGLPKAFLDWCYLDTTHWFDDTCLELTAMLHAVRPGGVLGFHDFVIEAPSWRGGVVIPVLMAIAERVVRPIAVTHERFPSIFLERMPD